MKILVWPSTLNLDYRLGCTPSWWQLMKAFREEGHEVIAIPYLGDPIETLWWDTYENPTSLESKLAKKATDSSSDRISGKIGLTKKLQSLITDKHIKPTWRDHLFEVFEEEGDIDLLLMLNVPISHVQGIPTELKEEFGVDVAFFEGDAPTILPEYAIERGFRFNYYEDADLSEFDAFFTNSKGVIPDFEERGAENVHPIYWAVDPDLFSPVDVEQDYDVSFFGYGAEMREEWMKNLITYPSQEIDDARFVVGGGDFDIPLGEAELVGDVPYSAYGEFVCRSKINLNTTRSSHTQVYASATSRPFELAAYGACIVSQPYNGIEEWFDVGEELVVVGSREEARETIEQLLDHKERRDELGRKAREAVLERHTFRHRAREIVDKL